MTEKTPTRTCIACGKKGPKRDFLRIVRTASGTACLDPSGKASGRGAYVCANEVCLKAACKRKLLAGRLRTKICTEDYQALEMEFEALRSRGSETC